MTSLIEDSLLLSLPRKNLLKKQLLFWTDSEKEKMISYLKNEAAHAKESLLQSDPEALPDGLAKVLTQQFAKSEHQLSVVHEENVHEEEARNADQLLSHFQ